MKFEARDIFEDVAATLVGVAIVLGYTATHEQWNVTLIGDSRRWTTGLLCILGIAMFGLTARHIGIALFGTLAIIAVVLAAIAFWTASLTPLSLLAVTIVLAWAFAVLRDVFRVERHPLVTH
jgi:hypothetical protein